jgi:sulfide:quinone oxidoreductase
VKPRIVVLGAGFGGLELSSTISEAIGDDVEVTLIDKADAFVFGYAKLDVLFGHATLDDVRMPYRDFAKPGVKLVKATITAIDCETRTVTTDAGTFEADYLVIALGADLDASVTPGLVLGKNDFYSVAGALHLREVLPAFTKGHAVIGACGAPYKCPPATSECALMLDDYLRQRGLREACTITFATPLGSPVPPSPDASKVLLAAFAERGIEFIANNGVARVEDKRIVLADGRELPCDLFLGVPKNRAPDVVVAAGITDGNWVNVDPRTLETKHHRVWALGDLAATGTPKAGAFAESAAKAVAANIIAQVRGEPMTAKNPGTGACYVEFGEGRVGRVDVDFFGAEKPIGTFVEPSSELRADKERFGSARRERWFGR